MKKLVLILLGILNVLSVKAQVQQDTFPWCPPGARWVYLCSGFMFMNDYVQHSYIKDTLIHNKVYKVIESQRLRQYAQFPNSSLILDTIYYEFLREQNDTVYHFYEGTDKILYVMNANIGDSWQIYPYKNQMCAITDTTIMDTSWVTGIGLDTVSNYIFQTYQLNHWSNWASPYSDYWHIGGKIIKNIGSYHNFFPLAGHNNCSSLMTDDGYWIPLEIACYYDYERGFIKFKAGECKPCWDLTAVQKYNSNSNHQLFFEVAPNPISFQSSLNILNKNYDIDYFKVEIWDLNGKKLLETETLSPTIEISILNWKSGIYIAKIITEKGINVKKIMKL